MNWSIKRSLRMFVSLSISVLLVLQTIVSVVAATPTASTVKINGSIAVGNTITGSYTFNDATSGHTESASNFRWLRADTSGGTYSTVLMTGTTTAATCLTDTAYTIPTTDQGKYIKFEITPKSSASETGTAYLSSATVSIPSGPAAPTVSNITVTGTAVVGGTITGKYTSYTDANSDPESGSTYRWLSSYFPQGPFNTVLDSGSISVNTSKNYTITSADVGKYIIFEVTPRSTVAPTDGNPAKSGEILAYDIVKSTESVQASETNASYVASRVLDGNVSSIWTSSNTANNPYITINLGNTTFATAPSSTVNICALRMLPRQDQNSQSIKGYSILVSADSTNGTDGTWQVVNSGTWNYGTGDADRSVKTATFSGIDAKYVRLRVDMVKGYYSISEISIEKNDAGAPVAANVSISGDTTVGKVLTGSYTFFDRNADSEAGSTLRWLRADTSGGTYTAISGATYLTYTLTSTDANKYIKFEVTPISNVTPTTGGIFQSSPTSAIAAPPSASGVMMTGNPVVGNVVTGKYTSYYDLNGDVESGSSYRWLRSDIPGGVNPTVLESGTLSVNVSKNYTITSADDKKYIRFEVKPKNATQPTDGVEVLSPEMSTRDLPKSQMSVWASEEMAPSYTAAKVNDGINNLWTTNNVANNPSITFNLGNTTFNVPPTQTVRINGLRLLPREDKYIQSIKGYKIYGSVDTTNGIDGT